MNRPIRTGSILILMGLVLSACTNIPIQLDGDYTSLIPENATEADLDTRIRWGGMILETRPEADFTCFEILSKELGSSMRPVASDQEGGRFIACKPGFYDPEVFKKGREVTLTGPIVHMDKRKVGDYDYQFPVVDIDFMSLWPKRQHRVYMYGPYQPWYWHYPPHRYYYRYPYF